MGIVITFSGLHGTGKSTYSKAVSKEFNLRCISAGKLFRRIAKQKNFSLSKLSKLANKSPIFDQVVDNMTVTDMDISDHFIVSLNISTPKLVHSKKQYNSENFTTSP